MEQQLTNWRRQVLIESLQGAKGLVAKVDALIPRTIPRPLGRLVLLVAMPANELLGDGALGIVGTHKRIKRVALHVCGFGT